MENTILDSKNYKLKRPKEGYNTEKEREFAKWSGVSDWEVDFKGEKIGTVFYVGTVITDWMWTIDNTECKGDAFSRADALDDLIHEHQKIRRYS